MPRKKDIALTAKIKAFADLYRASGIKPEISKTYIVPLIAKKG